MRLAYAAALWSGLVFCGVPTPGVAAGAPEFRQICKVRVLCSGIQPGGGRIMQCLREHRQYLTVPCKLAIADFFLSRPPQGGGGGRGPGAGPRDRGGGSDRGGPDQGGPGPDRRGPGSADRGPGPDRGGQGPDGPDGGPDGSGGGPDGPDQGPPPQR